MKVFISVDDTNYGESPGSGQFAAHLSQSLLEAELIDGYSSISRHQLYVHPSIPYTFRDSSMCYSVATQTNAMAALIG